MYLLKCYTHCGKKTVIGGDSMNKWLQPCAMNLQPCHLWNSSVSYLLSESSHNFKETETLLSCMNVTRTQAAQVSHLLHRVASLMSCRWVSSAQTDSEKSALWAFNGYFHTFGSLRAIAVWVFGDRLPHNISFKWCRWDHKLEVPGGCNR